MHIGKIDFVILWVVEQGMLVCNSDPNLEHGDLLSDQDYENYDLRFDWRLQSTGNSGVFINVIENNKNPMAWASGPEYQLLGKEHLDMQKPMKRSGCLYGFTEQLIQVETKPADQWNSSQIVQKNGEITFYLNGQITAQEDFKSTSWHDKIKASSFKDFPDFGKSTSGHIALQDWTKGFAFKNIKILAL